MVPPDNECRVAGGCAHRNYDKGLRFPTKGSQRRPGRLAENLAKIGEMAPFGIDASQKCGISERIVGDAEIGIIIISVVSSEWPVIHPVSFSGVQCLN